MLEGALIKYFDADLRISAADISAPMIKLGRGGFTISTKDGVLASEVGELDLCGGEASGSVNVDLSREVAKANLVASLDDVPVEGCLDASFLVPFKGTTSLKAEMSGEGRTYPELIQALSGGLKVNATNGAIPLDLARLLAAAPTPLDGEGWSRNSVTLFDSLNADCRLGGGHIWCDMFNMQTRRGLIAGSGNVDMAQADARLEHVRRQRHAAAEGLATQRGDPAADLHQRGAGAADDPADRSADARRRIPADGCDRQSDFAAVTAWQSHE